MTHICSSSNWACTKRHHQKNSISSFCCHQSRIDLTTKFTKAVCSTYPRAINVTWSILHVFRHFEITSVNSHVFSEGMLQGSQQLENGKTLLMLQCFSKETPLNNNKSMKHFHHRAKTYTYIYIGLYTSIVFFALKKYWITKSGIN